MDYWLVKIDESGVKIWDKTYGGIKGTETYTFEDSQTGELYSEEVNIGYSGLNALMMPPMAIIY